MDPTEQAISRLKELGKNPIGNGKQWTAQCPAHEDRKASLSIGEGDNGGVVMNCHAGCDSKAVCQAMGMEESDLTPANTVDVDSLRGEMEELADIAEEIPNQTHTDIVEEFQPFPTDALPSPVRDFVKAGAKAIVCDESYIALPILSVAAAAIGNTTRLELKNSWSVPAIIWSAIVGESGTAKTPAFRLAKTPVLDREKHAKEQCKEDLRRYEQNLELYEKSVSESKGKKEKPNKCSLKKPLPPRWDRCLVSDTTVEGLAPILQAHPRGVLLERDELGGWLASFDRYTNGKGGGDIAHWLSMYNGESIIVDRKTGSELTINIPNASVSITGCIPPTTLHEALGTKYREAGLAARILLTCPPRKPKRWTEEGIDPALLMQYAKVVDRLYSLDFTTDKKGKTCPVILKLTVAAKEAWKDYYNSHNDELAELTGDLAAAWSKLEEYAARLALVIECLRWAANDSTLASPDQVTADSMAAGIKLAQWFKREARRVYVVLEETHVKKKQRQLAEWIRGKGGSMTVRDVQNGRRELKNADETEAAINSLVSNGYGHWEESASGKPGQPTRRFVLEPVYSNA